MGSVSASSGSIFRVEKGTTGECVYTRFLPNRTHKRKGLDWYPVRANTDLLSEWSVSSGPCSAHVVTALMPALTRATVATSSGRDVEGDILYLREK
jgi:hypothetical protein